MKNQAQEVAIQILSTGSRLDLQTLRKKVRCPNIRNVINRLRSRGCQITEVDTAVFVADSPDKIVQQSTEY